MDVIPLTGGSLFEVLFIAALLWIGIARPFRRIGRRRKRSSFTSRPSARQPARPRSPVNLGPAKAVDRDDGLGGSDLTRPRPAFKTLSGPAYVIDGDTIVVAKHHIRLAGIDAPELDHPYGHPAKSALMRLCKGQRVTVEILDQRSHDRLVGICRLDDGRDLSAELVKLGLALDWAKHSGGRYRQFETADARKRLWRCDARQKGRWVDAKTPPTPYTSRDTLSNN